MALEIFKLVGSIMVDNTKANESLSKTDDKAKSIGQRLASGIGTAAKWGAGIVAAAGAGAAAVGALATTTVKSYAEYEQLAGGVETLFKESAGIVMDYAKNAYKTAGMSANQYMETVTSFSASLLQGLNGDTAKAASVADMAITDMSDNANKMGTSLASIQNAYQGFSKQNYTMLDNLKLGYGGTNAEMERLLEDAEKLTGLEYNIDNLSDVYNAIHAIQSEMGITGTTAKEATTTLEGGIGMIKAKMEDFKVALGESIAPVVQAFITNIIDNLPTIEAMINQLTPIIVDLMNTVIPVLMQLIESLMPVLMGLFQALMPLVSTVFKAIGAAITTLVGLFNKYMPAVQEAVQKAFSGIQDFWEQHLKPCFDDIGDFIQNVLAPIFDEVFNGLIATIVQAAFEGIGDLWENTLKPIFTGITDFLTGVFTGDFSKAFQGIVDIVDGIFSGIVTVVKTPINAVIGIVNGFIRGLNKIKIPSWVPFVGGKGINIPTIPTLETGGILEKGQVGYLEGNGAEAVVPLDKNKKWIRAVAQDMDAAMGGDGQTIVVLTKILALLEQISRMGLFLDTGALVGGIAPAMDRQLGQIQAQKERS